MQIEETKLTRLLKEANARLKQSNSGISIYRKGQKLSLRGMFPPKSGTGKKKQQLLTLDIYFNGAGIQAAEKKAQIVASQLALDKFSWVNWAVDRTSAVGSLSYWVAKHEKKYFDKRERNEKSESTYKNEYASIYKRVADGELTSEKLTEMVLSTKPDSRSRKRAVVAANSLAKIAGVNIDFAEYKGTYSHLKGDRILPTDEEIQAYYQSIKNPHWQRAFALMAAYGVSNHELFYCDLRSLLDAPGHLISSYRKDHYGTRRIWCLYPEWYEQWELYKPVELPNVSGKNNQELGKRVTSAFARYGLCRPGDLRHCWAIRAMNFMPDAMAARMMAHSTAVHNQTYKRWINERQEDKFYELLMARKDRPLPP